MPSDTERTAGRWTQDEREARTGGPGRRSGLGVKERLSGESGSEKSQERGRGRSISRAVPSKTYRVPPGCAGPIRRLPLTRPRSGRRAATSALRRQQLPHSGKHRRGGRGRRGRELRERRGNKGWARLCETDQRREGGELWWRRIVVLLVPQPSGTSLGRRFDGRGEGRKGGREGGREGGTGTGAQGVKATVGKSKNRRVRSALTPPRNWRESELVL